MERGASRFLRKGAVEGARRDGVRVSGSFASSPQPALVRVAARGQPSGHLASGGGTAGSDEEAGAVLEASWKRMGEGLEEWRAAERKLWEQVRWSRGAFEALARARALAAALILKVAQAAFSERVPWVVRARVECA